MKKNYTFQDYLYVVGLTFYISSFSFGGGYVVIPMIRKWFVEKRQYLTESQLMEMAAIGQSSPGAIAVNLSVLTGYRILGPLGAVLTGIATVLPPLIILSFISSFYIAFRDNIAVTKILKGMEAGVCATIVNLVIDMNITLFKNSPRLLQWIAPLAFIATFFLNLNVALVIISCALFTLSVSLLKAKRSDV